MKYSESQAWKMHEERQKSKQVRGCENRLRRRGRRLTKMQPEISQLRRKWLKEDCICETTVRRYNLSDGGS